MSSELGPTELLVRYVDAQNVLLAVTEDVVRSFDVDNSTLLEFCVDLQPHILLSLYSVQRSC